MTITTGEERPVLDLSINYQKLRHAWLAKVARSALFRLLVGREGWPVVFRAPASDEEIPRGTSPHLYVHLPFCSQICPHCPYNKTLYRPEAHRAYGLALAREVGGYLERSDTPPVESLYFGGGTPSRTPDLVEAIIDRVRPRLAPAAEVGVEVHPRDAGGALLERLRDAGVNRVSLGIETFREDLLRLLGRTYTPEQAEDAIRLARAAGFDCVDANLIYGIPGQDVMGPAADAERCLSLGVDQISAYPLFTFVHTPLGRRIANGRFPQYGDRARIGAQMAISRACRRGGLARTSVWSFTRPGLAPYSTVTREDYVGFGAGAGSKVDGLFWFNTFSVDAYASLSTHRPALVMRASERLRRFHWLYWQVYRTRIDVGRYRQLFGRDLENDFGAALGWLKLFGWTRKEARGWRLTESGAIWAHRLQCLYSLTYIALGALPAGGVAERGRPDVKAPRRAVPSGRANGKGRGP
jgi:oxygen-independent coproporphyrinogen-3 oxidase